MCKERRPFAGKTFDEEEGKSRGACRMGKWDAVTVSVLEALSEDFIDCRLVNLRRVVLGTGCGEVLERFLRCVYHQSRRCICVSVCEFFIQP